MMPASLSNSAPSSLAAATVAKQTQVSRQRLLEALVGRYRIVPVVTALVLIWVFFATQSPVFLTSRNLSNLSLQIVVMSLVAMGLVLLLLIGEIDLSVAPLAAIGGCVAAMLSTRIGAWIPLSVAGSLVVGGVWGLLLSVIVTSSRAPSFIVTLGGTFALSGVLLQLLPDDTSFISLLNDPLGRLANSYLPPTIAYVLVGFGAVAVLALRLQTLRSLRRVGRDKHAWRFVGLPVAAVAVGGAVGVATLDGFKGVPLIIAITLVIISAFHYITTQTAFGTALFAIGGNAEAARRAGIHVNRIRIIAFVLAGMMAALGGVVQASRLYGVSPQSDDPQLLLQAIAAAVIGGTSLFGGRGSVWSAVIGALIVGSVTNGLLLMNVSTPVRLEVQGVILIAAVVFDTYVSRKTSSRS